MAYRAENGRFRSGQAPQSSQEQSKEATPILTPLQILQARWAAYHEQQREVDRNLRVSIRQRRLDAPKVYKTPL